MQTAIKQRISVREFRRQLDKYDDDESIDGLLKKPEVLSLLGEIFNNLSLESQASARKCFQPNSEGPTKEKLPAALAILCQVDSISLPGEIQELFHICVDNPPKFWATLNPHTLPTPNLEGSISIIASNLYLDIKGLRLRRKWDIILWRYFTLFCYDLALLIGDGQERITPKLLGGLLHILSTSQRITDDARVIETNLLAWCKVGSRYRKLCHTLDDGALFLLPQVADDLWENENLLPGSSFTTAIQKLSELGICEVSRKIHANTLGTSIRDHILEPFRWNLSEIQLPSSRAKARGRVEKVKPKGKKKSSNRAKKTRVASQFQSRNLSAENQRSAGCEASFNATNTGNNYERALCGEERAVTAQITHQSAFNSNPYCDVVNSLSLPSHEILSTDNSGLQLPLEQDMDWQIPQQFVHGRPPTGHESTGLEDNWPIPEVQGRPTTEQETMRLEDNWLIAQDFNLGGRLTSWQETMCWTIPDDVLHG